MNYLINCFLLIFPVILWNYFFFEDLPNPYQEAFFWKDIPAYISVPENILRIPLFVLPYLMKIQADEKKLVFYFITLTLYMASWCMQIYFPESAWSESVIGFTAPAFSALFIILSIGFIGKQAVFEKFPRMDLVYFSIGIPFIIFHTWHAYLIYSRL